MGLIPFFSVLGPPGSGLDSSLACNSRCICWFVAMGWSEGEVQYALLREAVSLAGSSLLCVAFCGETLHALLASSDEVLRRVSTVMRRSQFG